MSRKLQVLIVVMTLGCIIWYLSDESTFIDWVDMTKWLVGLYFAGNVGEHTAKAIKK